MNRPLETSRTCSADTALAAPAERFLGHDLRSALSDLIDGVGLLERMALPRHAAEQLARMRSAGESLAGLLDTALDFSAGDGAIIGGAQRAALDLHRFLGALEARWTMRAQGKGLAFHTGIAADVPSTVTLNRTSLDRILSNLLGNAIKYSETGRIDLKVDLRAGNELRFTVTDNGPGYSDAALHQIVFAQPAAGSSTQDGSGLGLHIARTLAGEMGGQFQASNGDAGGAVATLLLPEDSWRDMRTAAPPAVVPRDLAGAHILLAEDNDTSQILARQVLVELGARVQTANDGAEALALLDRHGFDLALIDIEMPRVDGLDLLRRLRAREAPAARMPVVALTAYVLPEDRARIFEAGADGLIAKPIMDIAGFGQAIAAHLDGAAPALSRIFDPERFAGLLQMTGRDLAPELFARLRKDLDGAITGLDRAVTGADLAEVQRHAHVLGSLAAMLGAQGVQTAAARLEARARAGARCEVETAWLQLAPEATALRSEIRREIAAHEGRP